MPEQTTATDDATSSPDATSGAEQTRETGSTDLGDAGKRALADLRKELREAARERDDARRRVAELEDAGRSELERKSTELERAQERTRELEAQVSRLEHDGARRAAAAAAGIPDQWQRLRGETEEELTADAKQLADWRSEGKQAPDLGAGARSDTSAKGERGMDQLIRRGARR
jgi:predicted nuclease with TOPRIM domain